MVSKVRLKGLVIFVFLIGLLSFGLYSCGGGGGGGSSTSSTTSTTKTATASVSAVVDNSTSTSTRAVSSSNSEGIAKLVVDLNNNGEFEDEGDKTYKAVITNGKVSFPQVSIREKGTTKVKLTIEKTGRSPFEKVLELSPNASINLKVETVPVHVVTQNIPQKPKSNNGYLVFGIYKDSNKPFARVVASRSDISLSTNAKVQVAIPVDKLSDNVSSVTAFLQIFDGKKDVKHFPGEFKGTGYTSTKGDNEPVALQSVSFAYMKLQDQNGNDLKNDFTDNKARTMDDVEMTVQLEVPCDNLDMIKDDDNAKNGVQVPLWTYNYNTGSWTYVGEGDLYYDNGTEVKNVGDIDNSTCSSIGYYVEGIISVANWGDYVNLDYPVIFNKPKTVCITIKDQNGNPVKNAYVYAQKDGSYVDGYTGDTGTAKLDVPSNPTTGWEYGWQSSFTNYMNVKIDGNVTESSKDDCDYEINITATNPFDAKIKVVVKDEDGNPLKDKWVEISSNSGYWHSAITDDKGSAIFDVNSEDTYTVRALGQSKEVSFDNNEWFKRVEIKEKSIAPQVDVYAPYSVKTNDNITAWIYAWDPNGDELSLEDAILDNSSVKSSCEEEYNENGYAGWKCTFNANREDNITFEAVVSDGKKTGNNSVSIQVVSNRPPEIYGIGVMDKNNDYADPNMLKDNEIYTFVAYAWDPDGDNVTYEWTISPNDKMMSPDNCSNTNGKDYKYTFNSDGDYTVKVRACDSELSCSNYSTVVHVGDVAPVIVSVGTTTENPEAGGTIDVVAYAYDLDNSLTSKSFSWKIDNQSVNVSNVYDVSYDGYKYTAKLQIPDNESDKVKITLTVDDGSKQTEKSFYVWLKKPIAITTSLPESLTLKEGESHTFTVSAEAGNEVTYTWYVNGDKQDAVGNEFTYTFDKSGIYTVSVIVSDGENSAISSCTVTVENPASTDSIKLNIGMEGVTVSLLDSNLNPVKTITTDATGVAEFDGVNTPANLAVVFSPNVVLSEKDLFEFAVMSLGGMGVRVSEHYYKGQFIKWLQDEKIPNEVYEALLLEDNETVPDENGDGYVDKSELYNEVLRKADSNGNGKLEIKEIVENRYSVSVSVLLGVNSSTISWGAASSDALDFEEYYSGYGYMYGASNYLANKFKEVNVTVTNVPDNVSVEIMNAALMKAPDNNTFDVLVPLQNDGSYSLFIIDPESKKGIVKADLTEDSITVDYNNFDELGVVDFSYDYNDNDDLEIIFTNYKGLAYELGPIYGDWTDYSVCLYYIKQNLSNYKALYWWWDDICDEEVLHLDDFDVDAQCWIDGEGYKYIDFGSNIPSELDSSSEQLVKPDVGFNFDNTTGTIRLIGSDLNSVNYVERETSLRWHDRNKDAYYHISFDISGPKGASEKQTNIETVSILKKIVPEDVYNDYVNPVIEAIKDNSTDVEIHYEFEAQHDNADWIESQINNLIQWNVEYEMECETGNNNFMTKAPRSQVKPKKTINPFLLYERQLTPLERAKFNFLYNLVKDGKVE